MKKLFTLMLLMLMASVTFAAEEKDSKSIEVCKQIAEESNLQGAEFDRYVEQCVKDMAAAEKEEMEPTSAN